MHNTSHLVTQLPCMSDCHHWIIVHCIPVYIRSCNLRVQSSRSTKTHLYPWHVVWLCPYWQRTGAIAKKKVTALGNAESSAASGPCLCFSTAIQYTDSILCSIVWQLSDVTQASRAQAHKVKKELWGGNAKEWLKDGTSTFVRTVGFLKESKSILSWDILSYRVQVRLSSEPPVTTMHAHTCICVSHIHWFVSHTL